MVIYQGRKWKITWNKSKYNSTMPHVTQPNNQFAFFVRLFNEHEHKLLIDTFLQNTGF